MKQLLITFSFLLLLNTAFAQNANGGKTISALWDEYREIDERGEWLERPAVLDKIKKLALAESDPADYYEACRLYYEGCKWKDTQNRGEPLEVFRNEIRNLDEPAVTFVARNYLDMPRDEILEFAKVNRQRLESGHHPELFKNEKRCSFSGLQLAEKYLKNDYECVAWTVWTTYGQYSRAASYFRNRFPMEGIIEYYTLTNTSKNNVRIAALNYLANKREDEFISCIALDNMLFYEFNEKTKKMSESSSADFLALRDKCKDIIRMKREFSGEEKELVQKEGNAERFLKLLETKLLFLNINDTSATINFLNCSDARLSLIKDDKEIWSADVSNHARRFFIQDKVNVNLPDCDDGVYRIVCQDKADSANRSEYTYRKYSLAARYKRDADGEWLLLMDSRSGKPMPGYENGFKRREAPDSGKYQESVIENGRLRLSPEPGEIYHPIYPLKRSFTDGVVLLDRQAYNPGETVNFTVACFNVDETIKGMAVDSIITVHLDSDDDEIVGKKEIKVDRYGHASGSFKLDKTDKQGRYSILAGIPYRYWMCGSKSVVTDFIPMNYDIVFDETDTVYHVGDSVTFSGSLECFNGYSGKDVQLRYRLRRNDELLTDKVLTPDPSGRFLLKARALVYSSSTITCTITATGKDGMERTFKKTVDVRSGNPPAAGRGQNRQYAFEKVDSDDIALRVMSGFGPTWVVTEVYGEDLKLKESLITELDRSCPEKILHFPFKEEYGEAVRVYSFFVKNGREYGFKETFFRPERPSDILPLRFEHLQDRTLPGKEYTITIKTKPGAVCTASIFKANSEMVQANGWECPRIRYTGNFGIGMWGGRVIALTPDVKAANMKTVPNKRFEIQDMAGNYDYSEEEPLVEPWIEKWRQVPTKDNFALTLAWEPELIADENGEVSFSFKTPNAISTFIVQVFAHDDKMRSAVIRKEISVEKGRARLLQEQSHTH